MARVRRDTRSNVSAAQLAAAQALVDAGASYASSTLTLTSDVKLPDGVGLVLGTDDDASLKFIASGNEGVRLSLADNKAEALVIKQGTGGGTVNYLKVDTTDSAEQVEVYQNLDVGSKKITNLAAPAAASDGARLADAGSGGIPSPWVVTSGTATIADATAATNVDAVNARWPTATTLGVHIWYCLWRGNATSCDGGRSGWVRAAINPQTGAVGDSDDGIGVVTPGVTLTVDDGGDGYAYFRWTTDDKGSNNGATMRWWAMSVAAPT